MAFRRRDEDTFTFEAKVEYTSAKAHLVEFTLGGRYWVPKSQIVVMDYPDIDRNFEFVVSSWWWGVKTEVADG